MTAAVYPVFLRLAGETVVIVGAGPVAASKLGGVLDAGARAVVVAPAIHADIAAAAAAGAPIELRVRPFEPADLDGARFVIAAAPPEVNRAVSTAAAARNLFVNAVDDVASATAYLGGVVRRGEVTVAISTGGGAPALAGLLREALDALLPVELDEWMALARRLRAEWKREGLAMERRRPRLLEALHDLYQRREAPPPNEGVARS